MLLLSKNEADCLIHQHRKQLAFCINTLPGEDPPAEPEPAYRASGLVYAREGVLFAGCKSLSELATAP